MSRLPGDSAIRVEHLSKLYRIGQRERYKTLRDTVSDAISAPFRAGASLLKGRRSSEGFQPDNTIWALKDVSFEVKRGEVVGIIGRNGAGKSTLLKILSRITEPSEGAVEIRGRVASLLEVGTGFHPELTGRENLYLNGALLGMKRAEMERKFDEILEFSGVEKFIDTPVKRYSSGMYVRLAFAVAAHLEPEILLVDEVLAVGDAAFQKKCLGKMGSVVKEGRTVLFVSHNMAAIRTLCPRTLYLDNGTLMADTDTERVVAEYLSQTVIEGAVAGAAELEGRVEGVIRRESPSIRVQRIAVLDEHGVPRNVFQSDEEVRISVTYECLKAVPNAVVVVQVVDEENRPILAASDLDDPAGRYIPHREPGIYRTSCVIPPNLFGEKRCYLTVQLIHPRVEHLLLNKVLFFDVHFKGYNGDYGSHWGAFVRPQLTWETRVLSGAQEAVHE